MLRNRLRWPTNGDLAAHGFRELAVAAFREEPCSASKEGALKVACDLREWDAGIELIEKLPDMFMTPDGADLRVHVLSGFCSLTTKLYERPRHLAVLRHCGCGDVKCTSHVRVGERPVGREVFAGHRVLAGSKVFKNVTCLCAVH
jgi:hypothetical protein